VLQCSGSAFALAADCPVSTAMTIVTARQGGKCKTIISAETSGDAGLKRRGYRRK
jgi:hypothetical protein